MEGKIFEWFELHVITNNYGFAQKKNRYKVIYLSIMMNQTVNNEFVISFQSRF